MPAHHCWHLVWSLSISCVSWHVEAASIYRGNEHCGGCALRLRLNRVGIKWVRRERKGRPDTNGGNGGSLSGIFILSSPVFVDLGDSVGGKERD